MAVIHTEKMRLSLAVPIMVVTAIAAGAGIWWNQLTNTPTSVTPIAPITSAPEAGAVMARAETSLPLATDIPATPQLIEKLAEDQKLTAKAIEEQPLVKPIKGAVTERPSFISEMEWSVFKAVAMQQNDPDTALTALVNKVRFFKQLEVLQDMPATADKAKRQLLANELLNDLPDRLQNGDYDFAGASQIQAQLLINAEPNPAKRKTLATRQGQLLQQIQAQLTQAASSASSSSSGAQATAR